MVSKLTKTQKSQLSRAHGMSHHCYLNDIETSQRITINSLLDRRLLRIDYEKLIIKRTAAGEAALQQGAYPECGTWFDEEGRCMIGCRNH